MPRWRDRYIGFDPGLIAGLLYRGETVDPDDDIPEDRFEIEKNLVQRELMKLWGS